MKFKITKKFCLKFAAWFAGILLALCVAGYFWLDWTLKTAINEIGSRALGVKVEVKGFRSSLLHGSVQLDGMEVSNPEGFQSPLILRFDRFLVDVDLSTLTAPTLVIEKVYISGLRVNYEPKVIGKSNLAVIRENIDRFVGAGSGADVAAADRESGGTAASDADGAKQKVVIADLQIRDSVISVYAPGVAIPVSVPLPPVTMTDLGENSLPEMIAGFFDIILKSVFNAVKDVNVAGIGNDLKNLGENAVQGVNSAVKSLLNVAIPGKK